MLSMPVIDTKLHLRPQNLCKSDQSLASKSSAPDLLSPLTGCSNWILREAGPTMGAAELNSAQITLVTPTSPSLSGCARKIFGGLNSSRNTVGSLSRGYSRYTHPTMRLGKSGGQNSSGIMREKIITHGRLRIIKTNSLGRHKNVFMIPSPEKHPSSMGVPSNDCIDSRRVIRGHLFQQTYSGATHAGNPF